MFRASALSLSLACILISGAAAQQQSASLTGQVTDASGAAVPDAIVLITDPTRGTKFMVKTNSHGDYQVPQLDPGDAYEIEVTAPGFKQTVQHHVALQVAQSAKIDFKMDLGDVSDSVTVESAPPQLDTQTSSLGTPLKTFH